MQEPFLTEIRSEYERYLRNISILEKKHKT